MTTSGWLDPEPPHAEHTEMECRLGLPKPRDIDHGRRFRCGLCGRIYQAHHGEQREPAPYWVGPMPEEGSSGPHSRSCGIGKHDHGTSCRSDCPTCHGRPL